MDLGKYAAATGFVTAFIAVWKLFAEGRATRISGKRLSYSFAIASGGPRALLRWFPGLRRRIGRSASVGGTAMDVLVFVWNSGTEAITSADFFQEKNLRVNVYDSRIVGVSVDFQGHSTVGADVKITRSSTHSQEWICAPGDLVSSSAEIAFSYLPPLHGAIFRICLRDLARKVPLVSVVGPIKGLRRTTFEGVVVSLPLEDPSRLRRLGRWIGVYVNVSLIGMGATVICATLSGAFSSGRVDFRYWSWMGAILLFEFFYLIAKDVRRQLMYRIPSKLAYWDPIRCDRD